MTEITTTRSNHLIDPNLHVWGSEVAVYLFLGGLVAGIMVLTGVWMLRRTPQSRSPALALLPWAAPMLLSLGMFFLFLDLENPFNALRFYVVLRPTSPMSWGSWILIAVYPVSILLALSSTPPDLRRKLLSRLAFLPRLDAIERAATQNLRTLAAASVGLGVALGVYTGLLLGTMAARPVWNSAVLGPLFLTSGVSTAVAFMLLYRLADDERRFLGRLDMGLIVAEMGLLSIWLIGLSTGGSAARTAASLFLGGPYTAAFWTMVVALGLLAPLTGEWIEHRHGLVPGRATAVLVLIGGFSLRWILVSAGQHAAWVTDLVAHQGVTR